MTRSDQLIKFVDGLLEYVHEGFCMGCCDTHRAAIGTEAEGCCRCDNSRAEFLRLLDESD